MIPPTNSGQNLSARRKYHTLDGIRGVAAIMVLMRHAGYYFGVVGTYISKSESYLAVDLFFALSGFVIAGAYDKRLAGGLSPLEFIKIRVIRLYPLYLLGLLIGTVAAIFSIFGNHTAGLTGLGIVIDFIFAFFMLPSPFSVTLFPINNPSWSLFFELIANAFYGFFYDFLTSGRMVFVLTLSAIGLGLFAYQNNCTDGGGDWPGFFIGIFRVVYSFGAGLLIHRYHTKVVAFRFPSWILLGFVVALLSITPSLQIRPWYDIFVVILMFPAIVHIASASESSSRITLQLYGLLGSTSYAVYILHDRFAPFMAAVTRKIFKFDVGQFAPFSGIIFLTVFIYVCSLLDRVYDMPIRRWATKIFLKK